MNGLQACGPAPNSGSSTSSCCSLTSTSSRLRLRSSAANDLTSRACTDRPLSHTLYIPCAVYKFAEETQQGGASCQRRASNVYVRYEGFSKAYWCESKHACKSALQTRRRSWALKSGCHGSGRPEAGPTASQWLPASNCASLSGWSALQQRVLGLRALPAALRQRRCGCDAGLRIGQ